MNGLRLLAVLLALVEIGPAYAGTFTTLDDPLATANGTVANGISGTNVVGVYYGTLNKPHGFLYDGLTYKTLDDPLGANGTYAMGSVRQVSMARKVGGLYNLG